MRDRVVAAWRVLRGEWVAQPPSVTEPWFLWEPPPPSSASTTFEWRRTG